jgi:hypothetical protein
MVLSGCRIRSNLTNEDIHFEGGTRRQCNRIEERKSAKAKRILVGADIPLQRLSSGSQVESGVIGVVESFSEPGGAVTLRREAM